MGTTLPTQFLFIIPISIPTSFCSTSSTTPKMSTTVHVKGISHETTEKGVKDFFSFCGKINSISVTPESDAPDAQKSATVTFEKETAAKTALLLDNTQLGKSQVHVSTASTLEDVASKAGAAVSSSVPDDHIAQEDKPRIQLEIHDCAVKLRPEVQGKRQGQVRGHKVWCHRQGHERLEWSELILREGYEHTYWTESSTILRARRQDGLQVWRCRGCLWLCARSLQLRQLCEEWSG